MSAQRRQRDAGKNEMSAKIFRFVRHSDVQLYADLGWLIHNSLDGTHHGQWSKLIEWPHDDPPPEPDKSGVPLAG